MVAVVRRSLHNQSHMTPYTGASGLVQTSLDSVSLADGVAGCPIQLPTDVYCTRP